MYIPAAVYCGIFFYLVSLSSGNLHACALIGSGWGRRQTGRGFCQRAGVCAPGTHLVFSAREKRVLFLFIPWGVVLHSSECDMISGMLHECMRQSRALWYSVFVN